jgi:ribosomal protein S18 acetylase RimI-like enzyme
VPQESPSIFLAPAAESDFEALVAIRIEAMRESLERIGRFDAGRARERFRSGFSPEHTRHIVVGTETVGFVVTKHQEQHLLLDHLYLLPSHQGRGIGSTVLQLVFAEAESLRLPVKVGALRESEANRFYARHGFQLVEQGEFDNYYICPARSAP